MNEQAQEPTAKTPSQFASGEVAYMLDNGGRGGRSTYWSQGSETPIFSDSTHKPIYKITVTGVINGTTFTNADGTAKDLPAKYTYTLDGAPFTEDTLVTEDITIKAVETGAIEVTITWGSMDFTYTDGIWNPKTHNYDEAGWQFEKDANKISIQSESSMDLTVSAFYENEANHTKISGEFQDADGAPMPSPIPLPQQNTVYMYFSPTGKPEDELQDAVIGRITVMIGDHER